MAFLKLVLTLLILSLLLGFSAESEQGKSRRKHLSPEQKLKRAERRASRKRASEDQTWERTFHSSYHSLPEIPFPSSRSFDPFSPYSDGSFPTPNSELFKPGALDPYLKQILGSGDHQNDGELDNMERMMDLMFEIPTQNQEIEQGYPEIDSVTEFWELYRKEILKISNISLAMVEILENLTGIFEEKGNATLTILNGEPRLEYKILKEAQSTTDSPSTTWPTKNICKVLMGKNITEITQNAMKMKGMKGGFDELLNRYKSGNLSKEEYMNALIERLEYNGIEVNCGEEQLQTTTPITTAEIVITESEYDQRLRRVKEFIKEGYLKPGVIGQLERGDITMDDVRDDLMRNEDFVLSLFPSNITAMYKGGRMPAYLETELFSGEHTVSELKYMLYQDDTVAKEMLPERIRYILETRAPPQELKDMLYAGANETEIKMKVMMNETLLEEMMSASMFYFYNLFKIPRNVAINMAMSGTTIVALCSVMTSLGCTMTVDQIMAHVRRPKGVIIALISQYGIMPAAAFGLTQVFDLDVYPAISVLICGCCPGGNLSNMLAFAINGDMNLSILMTTCSSVIGLGMMPLLLYVYSRFIIPVNSSEIVPFDKIILNVALTIVPVSIGIAIKRYRPTWTPNVMKFGAVMLVLCSIVFGVLAGFLLGEKFFTFFPPSVVACAAILPMTGYIFGFCFARLFRENQKCCRTICVETGCQNVQLCGTVLKLAFDPILVGVMILLPLIYMAFQASEALLLVTLYRLYEKCTGKKKDETKEKNEDFKFDSEKGDDEKKIESSDDDEKKTKEEEKPLRTDPEKKKNEVSSADNVVNGNAAVQTPDPTEEEAIERWPLVGEPTPEYLESFKKAGTENYV